MNTDGVPRPPDWKELYQLAVIELDAAKLLQRISDARNAVLDRLQENLTNAHYTERQELIDALNGLRVLQREHVPLQVVGERRAFQRNVSAHERKVG